LYKTFSKGNTYTNQITILKENESLLVGNEIMVVMRDENYVGGDFIVLGKLP
jgi:hypothetical protein